MSLYYVTYPSQRTLARPEALLLFKVGQGRQYHFSGVFLHEVFGRQVAADTLPHPRGWRWRREPGRDAFVLSPIAWHVAYRIAERVRRARHAFLHVCAYWGFLQAPQGSAWSAHRWSLRVWESPYNRPSHPYHGWFAFWKRLNDDWNARMPRWT